MKWLPTAGITDLRFKIKTLTGKHTLFPYTTLFRHRKSVV